jgi:MSHA biogenesis protein MshQ
LISLPNDSDLGADAQDDGDDLAFASEDGTVQYSHEIETFDGTSGTLVAWVKIPALSSSTDTVLYLYYGAGGGSREDAEAVWSNGYEAVYHLHDDFRDSTGNHDGSNGGSVNVAGKIGDGQEVEPNDGSPDRVDLGNWSVSGNQLTIQAWMRVEAWTRDDGRVISKADGTGDNEHAYMLSTTGSPIHRLRLRIKTGTSDASGTTTLFATAGTIGLGTWYLTAGTYDGATMRLLLDGVDVGSVGKTGNLRQNGWEFWAGDNPQDSRELDGDLDEIRISSAARSAEWLRTEYSNQFTPSAFHTVEDEEPRPATCP